MVRAKLLLAAVVLATVATTAHAGQLMLAVAANFTDTMRDLVALFEQKSGHEVKTSFGSTGKLFSQIENGAPFEVFLAADSARPLKAEREGLAVAGTRFTYAQGKLVLWSADTGSFNDGEAFLRSGDFSRTAIANPKTAPYGVAAKEVLQHLGLWRQVTPKLVRGESIAQTFQFTATGNAELGFVALSQVQAWGSKGSLWYIPESYYTPITQQAVLLKKGQTNPAATQFLEFLRSVPARELISSHGYGLSRIVTEATDGI